MPDNAEEPRGTPSIQAGVPPRARNLAPTDQLKSEIDQEHEASALDAEDDLRSPHTRPRTQGAVQPEPPERTPEALDGEADEIGIEIDNAIERPQTGDAGRRSS
jgi:hypothetical protein